MPEVNVEVIALCVTTTIICLGWLVWYFWGKPRE